MPIAIIRRVVSVNKIPARDNLGIKIGVRPLDARIDDSDHRRGIAACDIPRLDGVDPVPRILPGSIWIIRYPVGRVNIVWFDIRDMGMALQGRYR